MCVLGFMDEECPNVHSFLSKTPDEVHTIPMGQHISVTSQDWGGADTKRFLKNLKRANINTPLKEDGAGTSARESDSETGASS